MSYAGAEALTVQALQFIASDQELVEALLAMTGLRALDLRQAAADPGFGVSLLDFLLEDDQRVLRFARSAGIAPQEVMTARTALAGPGSYGWTAD
ncbi:Protein of unknown function [Paracoccus alcaliphilus]|uniref:DUF3572 domain-containing protein n=1 Tax=Paracoccus alcaliphilus TaxID=34002 RepID=A0A1H8KNY6_9RHOB|nr:DUF3572 domain-containing protein [Paracoccus alcaliphilus]WCR17297.1 DUF3572 domain-containing protein [Paracoccus alcaliphilus]SEN94577.1 Protein of unknown function [Paracoccus alcaliphilus]